MENRDCMFTYFQQINMIGVPLNIPLNLCTVINDNNMILYFYGFGRILLFNTKYKISIFG